LPNFAFESTFIQLVDQKKSSRPWTLSGAGISQAGSAL